MSSHTKTCCTRKRNYCCLLGWAIRTRGQLKYGAIAHCFWWNLLIWNEECRCIPLTRAEQSLLGDSSWRRGHPVKVWFLWPGAVQCKVWLLKMFNWGVHYYRRWLWEHIYLPIRRCFGVQNVENVKKSMPKRHCKSRNRFSVPRGQPCDRE